jgi:hypothetical protein
VRYNVGELDEREIVARSGVQLDRTALPRIITNHPGELGFFLKSSEVPLFWFECSRCNHDSLSGQAQIPDGVAVNHSVACRVTGSRNG